MLSKRVFLVFWFFSSQGVLIAGVLKKQSVYNLILMGHSSAGTYVVINKLSQINLSQGIWLI